MGIGEHKLNGVLVLKSVFVIKKKTISLDLLLGQQSLILLDKFICKIIIYTK